MSDPGQKCAMPTSNTVRSQIQRGRLGRFLCVLAFAGVQIASANPGTALSSDSSLLQPDMSLNSTSRSGGESARASGPESDIDNLYWDDQFGGESGLNANATAVAVIGNDVYVGGYFSTAGGVTANHIAKWNGTSWSGLGTGTSGEIRALATIGNDLYAAGSFSEIGGVSANCVAKWNGTCWSALGTGPPASVLCLAVSEGNVYAGGCLPGTLTTGYVAKWDGVSWSQLGTGMTHKLHSMWGDIFNHASVRAVAVIGNDVYAGGMFTHADGVAADHLAKWDGTSWGALPGNMMCNPVGLYPDVNALAAGGGNLYVGGTHEIYNGEYDFFSEKEFLSKWNGSTWSPLELGFTGKVLCLAVDGSDVYMGGRTCLGKWNGTSWSALGGSHNWEVSGLAVCGNVLFAAGNFTQFSVDSLNAKLCARFAAWQPRVNFGQTVLSDTPGVLTIGNDIYGFYKPALMTGSATNVGFAGGLPTTVTMDRADEIRAFQRRVNGACTVTPGGMQFSGDGAVLRVEFSEDDLALYGGVYTDFRAVELTYPADYPENKEAATRTILAGQSTPGPVRIENGKQIYAITAPVSQIGGTYGAINPHPPTGSLCVTLAPEGALSWGALWRVEGGAWNHSGATISVPLGLQTVQFKTVPNWTAPASKEVTITQGVTTTTGVYVQIMSPLIVTLAPAGAVSAGAQWRVDGGEWRNSDTSVSLVVGSHNLEFKPVTGWTYPLSQSVIMLEGMTRMTNGQYVQLTESLAVTITPAGAVSAGAQWRVDGGAWHNSDVSVSWLSVGSHTVEFKPVTGWTTPASQNVAISHPLTTTAVGVFVQQTGSLTVTLAPAEAVSAGAKWRVDGGTWRNSGQTADQLVQGEHQVEFSTVSGWITPAVQDVSIASGSIASPSGTYVTVTQSADVMVSAVASPTSLVLNGSIGCTATVTNNGPDIATGVVLAWSVPGDARYDSSSASQGSVSFASGTMTAYLGSIASGASATVSLNVTPTSAGTFTSSVLVTAEPIDTNSSNNTATLSVPVTQGDGPNLVSGISGSLSFKQKRSGISCTIKGTAAVTNIGDRDGTNVQFQVFLSDDNQYDSSDRLLRTFFVKKLMPGKTSVKTVKVMLPAGTTASGKWLLMVADPAGSAAEANEFDNTSIQGL